MKEETPPISRRKLISALAAGGIGAAAQVTLKPLPEVKGLVLSDNPDFIELTPFAGTPTKKSNSDMLIFSNANDNNEPYLEDTSGNLGPMRTRQSYDYIIEKVGSTFYARPAPNSGLATITSNMNPTPVIQGAVNALTNGGSIYLKAAIYNLTSTITLPYGLSFYFYGDGIPSWPYPIAAGTFNTPSDGTQLRGATSFLSTGAATYLLTDGSGSNSKGTVGFFNLSILLPWGATTTNTKVYGLYCTTHANVLIDNVMFFPWGWSEAGQPQQTDASHYISPIYFQTKNFAGYGTMFKAGSITIFGHHDGGYITDFDFELIEYLQLFGNDWGITLNGNWLNHIDAIFSYDQSQYVAAFPNTLPCTNRIKQVALVYIANHPAQPWIVYCEDPTTCSVDSVFNLNEPTYTKVTSNNEGADVCLEGDTEIYNYTTLLFQKALRTGIVTITNSAYTVQSVDSLILVSTGNRPRTITLPPAGTMSAAKISQILHFKKIDTGSGTVVVTVAGSDHIEGATTKTLAGTQYTSLTLYSDGVSTWYILGSTGTIT